MIWFRPMGTITGAVVYAQPTHFGGLRTFSCLATLWPISKPHTGCFDNGFFGK